MPPYVLSSSSFIITDALYRTSPTFFITESLDPCNINDMVVKHVLSHRFTYN